MYSHERRGYSHRRSCGYIREYVIDCMLYEIGSHTGTRFNIRRGVCRGAADHHEGWRGPIGNTGNPVLYVYGCTAAAVQDS